TGVGLCANFEMQVGLAKSLSVGVPSLARCTKLFALRHKHSRDDVDGLKVCVKSIERLTAVVKLETDLFAVSLIAAVLNERDNAVLDGIDRSSRRRADIPSLMGPDRTVRVLSGMVPERIVEAFSANM